ncbi:MAG: Asp-tRNA(Asn)/Glu-tRNA(Gln) amidotransferase subunit GatB [Bacteroidetes bacterium]|nr:Asp-tRNA(Asn)/Glu-tRNA(Gln) amidotransferase subunit GatB [Bacteroidota bacterium]
MQHGYETVVGIEIHAQLNTRSKIFSPDAVDFAGAPNTRIAPVTLGLPGVLPVLNRQAVRLAAKMGMATHCHIAEHCYFARKNYFYPDLPKGYQISQDKTPLCTAGHLEVRLPAGGTKRIGITRIHIEEDAGKSLHDQDPFDSLIDLNRAGVGLIEIVSEPDIRTPEEAAAYVTEIRKLVRYLGVCDGNMEEGNLRCDVNISVRKVGTERFGTRNEVKNVNSISNVARAIVYETERQIALLESGGTVVQETRTWDAVNNRTVILREKETADDYRYFPEPDLQPLHLDAALLAELRAELPELPEALYQKYTQEYGLNDFDAGLLTEQREFSDFYAAVLLHAPYHKAAANWLNGPVRSWLNEQARDITEFPLQAQHIAGILQLVESGKVSHSMAKEKLFPALVSSPHLPAEEVATQLNLLLETDTAALAATIAEILAANPDKVETYRAGKAGLLGFFVGQVMKATQGKADPKAINELLMAQLGEPAAS